MRRAMLSLVMVFLFCLLFAAPSAASIKLYADRIKDIRGTYDPVNNTITLKWKADITSSNKLTNTDVITVFKGTNDYNMAQIATINVNDYYSIDEEPFGGYNAEKEFTFTDRNVSLDEDYKYRVSCGSIASKWKEIRVFTGGGETGDEEEGAAVDRREAYENSADWPERLGGSILLAIPNYIVRVIGLDDPLELIYQVKLDKDDSDFSTPAIVIGQESGTNIYFHTFTRDEFEVLAEFYDRLNQFIPLTLVVVVVLLGVGFLFVSANPNSKLTLKDYIIGLLVGLLALKFGIYLIAVIFDINYMLVRFFQYVVGDKLSSSFLDSLVNTESNILGSAIITLIAVFSIGLINWQYTLRKVVLALLIALIPVVAVISIVPSKRNAIEYWMREFMAQVFLQSSHAAALTLIIMFIHANDANFWISLVGIMSLPAISSIVRRVVGAESFGTGIASGIGTALGLGSIFAISRMLRPNNKTKIPLDSAVAGTAAGVAAGTAASALTSSGGFWGNMAKTGFRTAAGLTAGVAGGLISGATTGNPGFGLVTGVAAGTAVSGGIVNTAQSVVDNFKKSPAERLEAHGIVDPAQLDDPNQAFEYGKNLFGGGAIGTVAGLGMAAGKKLQSLTGHASPEMARQVKGYVEQNTENLSRARQEVAEYKPVYEEARARAVYAKNMFGPNSTHMKELHAQASALETRMFEAEDRYAEALDDWHNNWEDKIGSPATFSLAAMESLRRVQRAGEESRIARMQFQEVQERIALGEEEFKEAQANLQAAEAEYAHRQATVNTLQQNLSQAGIRKEFENLRVRKQETRGGINTAWR